MRSWRFHGFMSLKLLKKIEALRGNGILDMFYNFESFLLHLSYIIQRRDGFNYGEKEFELDFFHMLAPMVWDIYCRLTALAFLALVGEMIFNGAAKCIKLLKT